MKARLYFRDNRNDTTKPSVTKNYGSCIRLKPLASEGLPVSMRGAVSGYNVILKGDIQRKNCLWRGAQMLILAAILLDALFGDPARISHPVVLIGNLISFLEKLLLKGGPKEKRAGGAILVLAVVSVTAFAVLSVGLAAFLISPILAVFFEIYLLYTSLAARSLKDETLPIAVALSKGDIETARFRLSRVVGRDTESLDEAAIVRASVETIAESYIDGVFSVLFWATLGSMFGTFLGGALMAWIYKAVNTMDSMVGYKNEKYEDFGRAAAKLDDVLNFIPARLGSIVAVAAGAFAGFDWKRSVKVFLRDRKNHRSPNSAHAESVFAGLLGISLGGGASYGGVFEAKPFLGDPTREPTVADIFRAHRILDGATWLCALILLIRTAITHV